MAGKHLGEYDPNHWAETQNGRWSGAYESNDLRGMHRKEGEAN